MKQFTILFPLLVFATQASADEVLSPFINAHCIECHSGDAAEANLDLATLKLDEADLERWVRVYDRVIDGEMPPMDQERPDAAEIKASMSTLSNKLTAIDTTRQQRDGRSRLRRLNRVEFQNTLRDLLALPALKLKESLPEDGRSHGFDRLSGALDMSFVHVESYLAAVDTALNAAICPFPEQPPIFKYRFRLTENIRKDGKECEGSVGLAIGNKTAIALVGEKVVPTDRHGALGWGVFSRGEHCGTVDLPPNQPSKCGRAAIHIQCQ